MGRQEWQQVTLRFTPAEKGLLDALVELDRQKYAAAGLDPLSVRVSQISVLRNLIHKAAKEAGVSAPPRTDQGQLSGNDEEPAKEEPTPKAKPMPKRPGPEGLRAMVQYLVARGRTKSEMCRLSTIPAPRLSQFLSSREELSEERQEALWGALCQLREEEETDHDPRG